MSEYRLGIMPVNAVEFSAEYSSPSLLGSDFHFDRYHVTAAYHFDTFLRNYLFPPQAQVMFAGGISTGTLPVQRDFVLDSQTGGLAPFGVLKTARPAEFVGDRFAMVSVEQNFRNVPFPAPRDSLSIRERDGNPCRWFRRSIMARREINHEWLVLRSRNRLGKNTRLDSNGSDLPHQQAERAFLQRRDEQHTVAEETEPEKSGRINGKTEL